MKVDAAEGPNEVSNGAPQATWVKSMGKLARSALGNLLGPQFGNKNHLNAELHATDKYARAVRALNST